MKFCPSESIFFFLFFSFVSRKQSNGYLWMLDVKPFSASVSCASSRGNMDCERRPSSLLLCSIPWRTNTKTKTKKKMKHSLFCLQQFESFRPYLKISSSFQKTFHFFFHLMGQWLSVEEVRAAVEDDLGLTLSFPTTGGVDRLVPPEACCTVPSSLY